MSDSPGSGEVTTQGEPYGRLPGYREVDGVLMLLLALPALTLPLVLLLARIERGIDRDRPR